MSLSLRRARAADVPELARLYADSVRALGPEHYGADAVEAWAAFADAPGFGDFVLLNETLVAEDGSGIVAFGGVDDAGRIASLYVRPDRIRRGVGSRLLEELIGRARPRAGGRIRAEASELSRPLFERYGFAVVERELVDRSGVPVARYRMERVD